MFFALCDRFFLFGLVFFMGICPCVLQADALFLVNDSPYLLTAIVQTRTGQFVAQKTFAPAGNMRESTRKKIPLSIPGYAYQETITPYIVVWKCAQGASYSICRHVNPGSYVQANSCSGNYTCPRKKQEKKDASQSSNPRKNRKK